MTGFVLQGHIYSKNQSYFSITEIQCFINILN